jgi:hypothetical protein
MKKPSTPKKSLSLTTETVKQLRDKNLAAVQGGARAIEPPPSRTCP